MKKFVCCAAVGMLCLSQNFANASVFEAVSDRAVIAARERLGTPKREIVEDRLRDSKDAQTQVKETVKTALQQFKELVNFDGGALEQKYSELDAVYDDCVEATEALSTKIEKIERVSELLFAEWEAELQTYSNATLKSQSTEKLRVVRLQYKQLIQKMHAVEKSIQPILRSFHDQVLFLKHNLNAQAIASLKGELDGIQESAKQLVSTMDDSIRSADEFIKLLDKPKK